MTNQQDDWNTLGEFFSDKPNLTHIQTVNILSKYSETLEKMLNKQFEHADINEITKFLNRANETLNGFGVENLIPEMNEPSLAMYVNVGDTYATTILYGIEEEKIFVCSWGTYYEETDWYHEYNKRQYQAEQELLKLHEFSEEEEEESLFQSADTDENDKPIRCNQCYGYVYDGECVNGCKPLPISEETMKEIVASVFDYLEEALNDRLAEAISEHTNRLPIDGEIERARQIFFAGM